MKNKELEKKIKEQYEFYRNTNAASIKEHVVSTLLKEYGYELEKVPGSNESTDVFFAKADNSNKIFVQVVNPNKQLNSQEQEEFISKLAVGKIEWGLLSNGQDYMLMNRTIELGPEFALEDLDEQRHEIVFQLNIFTKKDLVYMDYLSKQNLFETRVTKYFKHIAEFKALKYPGTNRNWLVYRGTIMPFFNYVIDEYKKYVELNRITLDDFEGFLRKEMSMKKNKDIVSIMTIDSKFSYIRSFFKTLKVKDSDFYEKKKEFLERFDAKEAKEYDDDILNAENIRKILKFYDDTREPVRYKTMLFLCLAYGLERSQIVNLTIDQMKDNCLLIDGRKLPIPSKLGDYIQELISINLEKGADKYIFTTKYRGELNQSSDAQINYVFDILQEIDRNSLTWKKLNPAYIRYVLIKMLFKNNYSIEEIVYLTGVDLTTFTKLISTEEIIRQVESRKKNYEKFHPFTEFLGDF